MLYKGLRHGAVNLNKTKSTSCIAAWPSRKRGSSSQRYWCCAPRWTLSRTACVPRLYRTCRSRWQGRSRVCGSSSRLGSPGRRREPTWASMRSSWPRRGWSITIRGGRRHSLLSMWGCRRRWVGTMKRIVMLFMMMITPFTKLKWFRSS